MAENEKTPLLNKTASSKRSLKALNNKASDNVRVNTIPLDVEANPTVDDVTTPTHSDLEQNNDVTIKEGHLIKASYESLDYEISDNMLYQTEEKEKSFKRMKLNWRGAQRWIICLIIGVLTGLTAGLIDYAVEKVSHLKFECIKDLVDECDAGSCLWKPQIVWFFFNMGLVLSASLLTVLVEPVAAGSGIPQIKCYLNGVIVPHVVRIKTLIAKVIGVVCAVSGGLAVGKEGPMIHSGAVIAAGVSQGRCTSLGIDCKLFQEFRSDTEKRDFVSAGAAAGVSAAFGAPVGGVLFSLEEGASFWNQSLVWRIFFSSMISTMTLNVIQGFIKDHPWDFSYAGLIDFGTFDAVSYTVTDLLIVICMGAFGGLLGALFNFLNYKLTVFRMKKSEGESRDLSSKSSANLVYLEYVTRNWHKIVEVLMVAAYTPCFAYLLIFFSNDCRDLTENRQDNNSVLVKFFCNEGEYSSSAKLFFDTPEATVKHLFHSDPGTFKISTLSIFASGYFFLACWTYGISVPSGLFIPSLLVGAAWGRIVGILVYSACGNWVVMPFYSLVGASAMLGGIVRMTISLTVIIMEATSNVPLGLPVMIALIVAKWVGDQFNEGIYDLHIHLQGVPLLGWEPLPMSTNISAKSVMSHPVTVFRMTESVERIVKVLKEEPHNGFPVVENYDPDKPLIVDRCQTFGTFKGLILRHQLITMLEKKLFEESPGIRKAVENLKLIDFSESYPRYTSIQKISISPAEKFFTMNLEPFINQSHFIVLESASYPSIFRKFRSLGLRHMVVINFSNQVIGIVTRKDLARYMMTHKNGELVIEQKTIIM